MTNNKCKKEFTPRTDIIFKNMIYCNNKSI